MHSCFFIGHREASEGLCEPLAKEVERHIVEYGVTDFVVGGKVAEVEPTPHFGGLIRRFLPRPLCLAPARLHQPEQKSLESCSPKCARQFLRSGFWLRQGNDRREYFRISKGGDAAWAKIRP